MNKPLSQTATLVPAFLLALVAVALGAPAAGAAPVCGTSWTGGAGSWGDPQQWTRGVPTATTVACFPETAQPWRVHLTGKQSAAAVVIGRDNTLVLGSSSSPGDLTVGAAGITNDGSISVEGSGSIVRGRVVIDPGANIEVEG